MGGGSCIRHWLALIALLAALAIGSVSRAVAQDSAELDALNQRVVELYGQGNYAQALPVAQKAVQTAEKLFGEDHPAVAGPLLKLTDVLGGLGRIAECEPYEQRALAIREKALGPMHPDTAAAVLSLGGTFAQTQRLAEAEQFYKRGLAIYESLSAEHAEIAPASGDLATLYFNQGRYAEAEPLYQRSLALYEKALGPNHPNVGTSLNNLAVLYVSQGRYAEAEPLYLRGLALREKALGPDHPDVGQSLNNLAELYRSQGRYAEAEPLFQRSLALYEKALGPDHPNVGTSLNNLAVLYESQGRYAEAEPPYQRSLAVTEKALGPDHPAVGTRLHNLAGLYLAQGRYAEAEPLHKRTVSIFEKALGPDHPDVGTALTGLAVVYVSQGRYAEAEPLYRRGLALHEKALGPDHPNVGTSLNNLAALHRSQGRYAEAEPLYQRGLAVRERALGPDHPDVGTSLNSLAELYRWQGRHAEAEPLYQRSLAIYEKALGPDHPRVSTALDNLAIMYFAQRQWARAADFWRRSTALTIRRARRGTPVASAPLGKGKSEAEQVSYRFLGLVKALKRIESEQRDTHTSLARETFATVQWAQGSEAAASLAQMAARGAKGDPGLATIVRERQDLVAEWQRRDGVRTAAVSQAPDKRDRAAEVTNVTRLAGIDIRIAEIDKQLAAEFPNYAALSRPEPLSVEEVQAQLRPDEALVLFLDTDNSWMPQMPGETFIWVVNKTNVRWVRAEFGTLELTRMVAVLRCGLDGALWDDEAGARGCRDMLLTAPSRDAQGNIRTEALPFDTTRSHALYQALFGQVEDLIRGKHLLIVPSGPLAQLPFQVLVTDTPDPSPRRVEDAPSARWGGEPYRSVAWLAKSHAITVLPAVSSLKALRRVARESAATKPLLGIGNPLLDGDPAARPWEAQWAKLARDKQACAPLPTQQVAGLAEKRRSVLSVPTRSGRADLDHLRSQSPLHDTADELCAVAADLKLAPDDIVLGARATEAAIKTLSAEGKLANYRVVHFATHGSIAGEIEGTSEPGLILTPPKEQTELDDGYLSASEVAGLKLDADWVILSACNTAAGGAAGAEALSGLARAFFYAGARAMLVSHWAVDSAATVKLVTHAVGATKRGTTLGRAEALRQAMLAMIDKGEAREDHPAFWAPFVVVGEGAAGNSMGQVNGLLPHGTKAVRKPARKGNEDWRAEIWKKHPY